jgi:hypothetical protein
VKVTYHVFKDYKLPAVSESDEQALSRLTGKQRMQARKLLYSFVSMCHHPARNKLFLGATHRGGDILIEFDLQTKKFRSCGFARSGLFAPGDQKIHKGLALDEQEDAIYFGTATLIPMSESMEAEGGKLLRYDIATGKFRKLATPTKGDFYQGTLRDARRGMMYMFTGRGSFAVYDLRRRRLVRWENMESCPHNGCMDADGGVWGVYGAGRQEFFRYNPDRNRFEFPGTVLPNALAASNVMYHGAGPVDGFIDGGDGFLYIGSPLGELYRMDYRGGGLKYLGKPFSDRRLPGLAVGPDGWLYLAGGNTHTSMLARYSREEERFEFLGNIEHPDGTYLHYAHELVVVDGTVYVGETDNKTRSGYLWACEL